MAFAVVKGLSLRATKVDRCGTPLPGLANRIVTDGFIRVNLDPNMKDANELTQENAAGKECVSDRTPPERRWWNTELQLCGVDPDLWSMVLSWARVLDYDGNPIGVRDRKSVDADTGVMFEVWTGGEGDDDCPPPTDDSIFSAASTGKQYGYLAFAGSEFVSGAIPVEAAVSTFTISGRTIAPKNWGRGPYNVAAIDSNGTPGRLLVPAYSKEDDNHLLFFRTPVEPPKPTDGACELNISSVFAAPNYYFGGPASEPAADVAPPQPICNGKKYTVAVSGTGNWKAKIGTVPSANIAHTALASAVQSAIEALSNVEVGQVQVVGTAGNYTVTLDPSLPALTADSTGLTGGTVTVTPL
ncbi:hypothetical protein [Mycobacterium aquaticum]|uniref:Uncharacterized protein n=1 Tax=Mycobacterium aquaticum TaxID=1927124 RepID=A0A1X0B715_9MYCO|nr:hypothetical protein [Mycobacterium aquaticum]ORA38110.1 hypothetical protein BST13_05805 [Mycobacterium aquaticum]